MAKIAISELNDVTWRGYRKFTAAMRELTPSEDGLDQMGLDELRAIMIVAALRSGWVKGVSEEQGAEYTIEMLDDMHPGNVIEMGKVVQDHYEKLRTPDPN